MPPTTLLTSLTFQLHVAGSVAEGRLSERLVQLDLKPKHVALLSALRLGAPGSQADLAVILGVAPSLVVALADHLEALGAVTRERDTIDRRRQQLALTDEGRRLLDVGGRMCAEIDAELTDGMSARDRAAVVAFLGRLASAAGIPVDH